MAFKKHKRGKRTLMQPTKSTLGLFFVCTLIAISVGHFVLAESTAGKVEIVFAKENPNFHVRTITTQFFEDNDAAEMIPIIRCESNFRQFEPDGSVLKNTEGSSAIGAAQILSSKHPDPRIVTRYNKKLDMDMSVEDFDLRTLEGNLGYALVLYKVRGVRDWECSKKFRF